MKLNCLSECIIFYEEIKKNQAMKAEEIYRRHYVSCEDKRNQAPLDFLIHWGKKC